MGNIKGQKEYFEMTREELEQVAKEKGVPGRSTKSKEELVHDLETWQGKPPDEHSELHTKSMDELQEIAKEKNISGSWEMNKEELVTAIQMVDESEK